MEIVSEEVFDKLVEAFTNNVQTKENNKQKLVDKFIVLLLIANEQDI